VGSSSQQLFDRCCCPGNELESLVSGFDGAAVSGTVRNHHSNEHAGEEPQRLLEIAPNYAGSGAADRGVADPAWRDLPVSDRLRHALVEGIDTFVVEDTEEARLAAEGVEFGPDGEVVGLNGDLVLPIGFMFALKKVADAVKIGAASEETEPS